jgi:hypothetical protein
VPLFRRYAPDLDFDIVIGGAGSVAVGMEANVTGLSARDRDDASLMAFDIARVLTLAETKLIGVVVVKDGRHSLLELGIIRKLNDDCEVDTALAVEVPDGEGMDGGGGTKVDLDPLVAAGKLDLIALVAGLVAISNIREIAGDSFAGVGGDFLTEGEVGRCGWDLRQLARAGAGRLEVGDLKGAGGTSHRGLGQLEGKGLGLGGAEGNAEGKRGEEEAHSEEMKGAGAWLSILKHRW